MVIVYKYKMERENQLEKIYDSKKKIRDKHELKIISEFIGKYNIDIVNFNLGIF
jgi:hypothetical protein